MVFNRPKSWVSGDSVKLDYWPEKVIKTQGSVNRRIGTGTVGHILVEISAGKMLSSA